METKIEYKSDATQEFKLICEKYWSLATDRKNSFIYTCREIGKEFGFSSNEISTIAKKHATLIILDCQCSSCGTHKTCCTRSELIQLSINSWTCDDCRHQIQQLERRDYLIEAEKIRQQELEVKRNLIALLERHRQFQNLSIPSVKDISNIDHLLLVAVIESVGADNLETTISLRDNLQIPLSPLHRLDAKILRRLCSKNLLLFNTHDAEHYVEAGEQGDLKIDFFQINFNFAYNKAQLHQLIIDSKGEEFRNNLGESLEYREWCQRIQLEECIRYLNKRSEMNDLSPSISEKMESLLDICLLSYSISEVYYIIWGAVENASSYRNKPCITRIHASNSIYGNIQRRYDDITNYNLKKRQYNRDSQHPQSAVEKVFFDRVYRIRDCGFRCTVEALLNSFESEEVSNQSPYTNLLNMQNDYSSVIVNVPKI